LAARGALFGLLLGAVALTGACSAEGPGEADGDREGDGLDVDSGTGLEPTDPDAGDKALPPTPNCGDGVRDDDEACDDGGLLPDDGCWSNCRGIDRGFICPSPGAACLPFAKCGDGVVAFPEQCDDGGVAAGDGCNDNCKLELGYKCPAGPDGLSVCSPTTCGDDVVEGAEMCEPGLESGCTSQCQFAPECGDSGPCTSECGDGLVLGEACDDANLLDGDGCSASCEVEPGYTCADQESVCQKDAAGSCILRIPVTYRDFSETHSDFGPDSCGAPGVVKPGLVEGALSSGKPVGTTGGDCTTKLSEWYVDSSVATTFHSELVLYENADGNYVNRWGAAGEPFYWTVGWGGPGSAQNCSVDPCGPYDGDPFFHPVDGIPGARDDGGETAAISDDQMIYGGNGTVQTELALTGVGDKHNFAFTSEITYWFAFDETTDARLEFVGDDDVWVFVNGELAIDLGGKHAAAKDDFVLLGGSPSYGMIPGNVYEIKVFHAERQANGSTFKLTLSGFDTRRSDCRATCGDGIIGFGEECDDGQNDGGYNECQEGCRLGGYCGDGVVEPGEACDDAAPDADPNCRGCRIIVVR
jgi:fibro-slime domain-containing protein